MAKNEYVVKFNEATDLFMIHYDPSYELCQWGSISNPNLLVWGTLEAAQQIALAINGGTVGTPK